MAKVAGTFANSFLTKSLLNRLRQLRRLKRKENNALLKGGSWYGVLGTVLFFD